jgi:guanylate kinase
MTEENKKGRLFIVTAPSGAGKTSLVKALVELCPQFKISTSHTTRKPRQGEREGVEYYFVDNDTFETLKNSGEFLENAECHGAKYGTAMTPVEKSIEAGKDIILEIDYQGAINVKKVFTDAISLFIIPPSMAALQERLEKRGQNSEAEIKGRLAAAKEEISHLEKFDYVIINDEFNQALRDLKSVFNDSPESINLETTKQKIFFQSLIDLIK